MIRVASSLLLILALAACGGSSGDASAGENADLVVLSSGPGEVNAGETVTFVDTVANQGPAVATHVTIAHHLDGAPAIGTITCAATGGASCPATLGESMTLASLPVGGGLIFHIEVPGAPDRPGPVTSSMTAHADEDTNHANDTGESTTIALDLRNGDYTVFASNGRQYTLTLNFNELTYEMFGPQVNASGGFVRDPDGVSYVFNATGTARFRTAPDLIVGGFDFNLSGSEHDYDHGVRPFVAARSFVSSLASLANQSYNQMGLNLRRSFMHPTESPVLPSTFGSGVLHVCTAPTPVRVDQCPAQFLADYALSINAGVISGVDHVNNDDTIHFRVAMSGSNRILLRAEDASDETGRHFRVGLPETAGLAGGSFAASGTRASWGNTTLSDTHYSFSGSVTGGATLAETADLVPLLAVAPTGMRRGTRVGDSAQIFLAQGDAMYLMLGEQGGLAQGLMDIGLH